MPNRILRDWTTSEAIDSLTPEQECTFTRILMAVDDFGRFEADPRLLAARLYPLRICKASAQQMQSACDALAKQGIIKLYQVEGRKYLQIVKWQNVPRAKTSKFPAMPDSCTADAQQMQSTCIASAPVTVTGTATEDRNREPEPLSSPGNTGGDVPEDFKSFWQAFPRKVGKEAALKAWMKAKRKPPLQDILAALESAKQSEQWTKSGGQFIPHPATWINQGRWHDEHEIDLPQFKPEDPNALF